jgi:hypothetical protein
MKSLFYLLLLASLTTCTNLDDPFAGVNPENVFSLSIGNSKTTADDRLLADGRDAVPCLLKLNPNVALYDFVSVTVSSDELRFSLSGTGNGATNSLIVPFSGQESTFYAIAPRNFSEQVSFMVNIGNARQIGTIELHAVVPNRLDVTPNLLRTSPSTAVSFTVTLADTSLNGRAISGRLPVIFERLSPAGPAIPVARSVAQDDGTATVTANVMPTDTGTFRYRARLDPPNSVRKIYSPVITIKSME